MRRFFFVFHKHLKRLCAYLTFMTLKAFVFRHTNQQQVRIAREPLTGNEQPFTSRKHIILLTTKDGVAKFDKWDAQPSLIEYNGHIGLKPIVMPGVILLHTERTNVIDMVGRLDNIKALLTEPRAILPEPVHQVNKSRKTDNSC